jgi:Protein of unknown function (DUF4238)
VSSQRSGSLKSEPLRHHYVPVFYQKSFADMDGRLWMYDRKFKTFSKPHPKVICCENDLYTISPKSGPDRVIESEYLSAIDSAGAHAIRQLERGRPSRSAIEALSAFAAHQITRTPTVRAAILGIVERIGEDIARTSFATLQRAKEVLARQVPHADWRSGRCAP